MQKKKFSIKFTFPNLSSIPQRGNVSNRLKKAREIEKKNKLKTVFDMVEVPADFTKNQTEMKRSGLSIGEMLLSQHAIESIYEREEFPSNKYILHTEPSLSRPYVVDKKKKSLTPKLLWYDLDWVKNFEKQLFLLIEFFNAPPKAIELHPGISNRGKNSIKTFTKAIQIIVDDVKSKLNQAPLIMIENRTGQIIQDGESIANFWNYFKRELPNYTSDVGIILDIQQFYTVTKSDFLTQLNKIPIEAICGAHIHTKHCAPNIQDVIPWRAVFNFLKKINESRNLFILPEVHSLSHLIKTMNFIDINYNLI